MKRWLLAWAMLLLAPGAIAADVTEAPYLDGDGGRVLRQSVVVDAPRVAVFAAFRDDATFMAWTGTPVAHIAPGNDGTMEFGLTPGSKIGDPGNVRHRILLWVPGEMIVWRNEFVPAGGPFDPQTFAKVRTILIFVPVGDGKTRVSEVVTGFGTGAKDDELYDHLRGGNAAYLKMLADHFTKKGE